MLVSCLMPTYNKCPTSQHLVEEAIQSFLLQTNTQAELLVCNDCPAQKLQFEHERVRMFNLPTRFVSLGHKLNYMTQQATGSIICRWDDDDICLPWRIDWCVDNMRRQRADFFIPGQFWATNGEATSFEGGAYAQGFYLKTVFDAVGGYDLTSFGEDLALEQKITQRGFRVVRMPIPQAECCYLYRWGTGSEHLSGYGRNGNGWWRIGRQRAVTGTFRLEPHWREDYVRRVRDTLRRISDGSR